MDLNCIYSIFKDEQKKRDFLERYRPGCSLKFDSDGKTQSIKTSIEKIPYNNIDISKEVKYFEQNYFSEDKLKTSLKSKGLTDLNISFSKQFFKFFNIEIKESFNNDSDKTKNSETKIIHCVHSICISLINIIISEEDVKLKDSIMNRFKDALKIDDLIKRKRKILEIYDIFGMFIPLEFTLGGKYNVYFETKDINEKDNIIKKLNNLTNLTLDTANTRLDYKNNKIEEFNNEIKKSQYTISLEGGDITQKYDFEKWINSLNADNLEIIDFKTLIKIHDFCGDLKDEIDDVIREENTFLNREGFNQLGYLIDKPDVEIKIMILGDSYNGKTTLINRLKSGTYVPLYQVTITLDFVPIYRKVKIDDKEYLVKTTFVDTAGQEINSEKSLGNSFIKQCDGFAIIYDISKKDGLNNIKNWKKKIDDNSKISNPPIILIGNKSDKIKRVKRFEAIKIANDLNIDFGNESSCKDLGDRNLENNIEQLIIKTSKNKMNREEVEKNITPVKEKKSSGGGCCN